MMRHARSCPHGRERSGRFRSRKIENGALVGIFTRFPVKMMKNVVIRCVQFHAVVRSAHGDRRNCATQLLQPGEIDLKTLVCFEGMVGVARNSPCTGVRLPSPGVQAQSALDA